MVYFDFRIEGLCMMYLTELVHFDEESWAILADIQDIDSIRRFKFFTLEFHGSKPRTFFTTPFENIHETLCSVRYEMELDINKLQEGDNVFYFVNNKKFTGKYECGEVRHGRITSLNERTGNIIIDHELTLKLVSVMKFNHNYEQVNETDAWICERCQMIHTARKAAN